MNHKITIPVTLLILALAGVLVVNEVVAMPVHQPVPPDPTPDLPDQPWPIIAPYTAGTGLELRGTEFSIASSYRLPQTCADGQIAEWNGTTWMCGEKDTGGGGDFWSLNGNAGTDPAVNFLGTTDEVSLTLAVSGTTALRLVPTGGTPNVIGGHETNTVISGTVGATIGGGGAAGFANRVAGDYATIGGGRGNNIRGNFASIGGGEGNSVITGTHATIAGGRSNTVSGNDATIGGGWNNNAGGIHTTVGGGFFNTADGGVTTISGGAMNMASGTFATIAGGGSNTASGDSTTIGGGGGNTASGEGATIGGGGENTASGVFATISGGSTNVASGERTVIGGGWYNTVSGNDAAIGGGSNNRASGSAATVPGGYHNTAQGDYSFAAGRQAKANNDGCFVWGDATDAGISCNNDNRTIFRSSGGFYIYTNGSLSSGVYVPAGGNAWSSVSDRNRKENFAEVDTQELLARLAEIPITTWNYKSQDPTIRHIGPMAQDFYTAFGVGEDDKHISTVDADGVALAAIQGLYAQVQELKAENAALQAQVDDLAARVEALERGSVPAPASVLPGLGLLLAGAVVGLLVHRNRGLP